MLSHCIPAGCGGGLLWFGGGRFGSASSSNETSLPVLQSTICTFCFISQTLIVGRYHRGLLGIENYGGTVLESYDTHYKQNKWVRQDSRFHSTHRAVGVAVLDIVPKTNPGGGGGGNPQILLISCPVTGL